MKRISSLFIFCIILVMIAAGCSSPKKNLTLDSKHQPLPDYVLNSSEKVKETYIIAATYPKEVASVPCYCGCVVDGHKSNLDCYVQQMGPNNAVEAWDQHGIGCDTCINITNDTIQMHDSGKSTKEIYKLIKEKYGDLGDPTPTPEPK
jgi:hypothetical protein